MYLSKKEIIFAVPIIIFLTTVFLSYTVGKQQSPSASFSYEPIFGCTADWFDNAKCSMGSVDVEKVNITYMNETFQYAMWYEHQADRIGFLLSHDGLNWTKVCGNGYKCGITNESFLFAPEVLIDDGIFYIYTTRDNGNTIYSSANGYNLTLELLIPNQNMQGLQVVKVADRNYIWYFHHSEYGIYARSSDSALFADPLTEILVIPNSTNRISPDQFHVGRYNGSIFVGLYGAKNSTYRIPDRTEGFSVFLAISFDGVKWYNYKRNPIIPAIGNYTAYPWGMEVGYPSFLIENDTLRIWHDLYNGKIWHVGYNEIKKFSSILDMKNFEEI